MKSCDRGEALVELADKFTKTISDLVSEIKRIDRRIDEIETRNNQLNHESKNKLSKTHVL